MFGQTAEVALTQALPLLQSRPLTPLVHPGKQIGDFPHSGFADWISSRRSRRQVEQFNLNIGSQVIQTHDLTDALTAKATEPRDISIVLRVAPTDHFIEVDCQ